MMCSFCLLVLCEHFKADRRSLMILFFRISAYLCNTNQKMCRFSRKIKGDEKILCTVTDSVLAKCRHVAALHQIQGLSQTAIIRKHKYSHRLVQRWMNVPHTAPDTAFGRHPGGGETHRSSPARYGWTPHGKQACNN